jgi:hypothetical protein
VIPVFCRRAQTEDFDPGNKRLYREETIGILRAGRASRQHGERSNSVQKDDWRKTTMEQTTQAVQGKGISTSRRSQIRYPLRTPVIYKWQDTSGSQRRARGWTRDISEAGAYVLSNQCPKKGEIVELTFKLLGFARQHTSRDKNQLEMGGEVVRVDFAEIAGVGLGFAVRSKSVTPTRQTCDPTEKSWMDRLALNAVCN